MASPHPAPTISAPPSFQNMSTSPLAHTVSSHSALVRLNTTDDTWEPIWNRLRAPHLNPRRIPHRTRCWYTSKEDDAKKALAWPPRPSSYDCSDWCMVPEMDPGTLRWDICHLLSLPKELRLEIWKYVLTDPSVPELAVEITRAPLSPSKTSLRFPTPNIQKTLQPPRSSPININLLLANRFIYEEALPVLYHSVKFAPVDLEGLFPLFLDSLSPYARSLIRHVKLRVPSSIYDFVLFGDPATALFHWAITCAQVAKVEALRDVEVEGFISNYGSKRIERGLLNPLCKIKAKKTFGDDDEGVAQRMLAKAEYELRAQAEIRETRTRAEAVERAARDELLKQQALRREEEQSYVYPLPETSEASIDHDISQMPGIRQFVKELEEHAQVEVPENAIMDETDDDLDVGEWELVSTRSGASTPTARSASFLSKDSVDIWTDTASTIVDEVDASEEDEENSETNSKVLFGMFDIA